MLAAPLIHGVFRGTPRRVPFLQTYLASLEAGYYRDFTRTDGLFQEDVGPTPASVANDPIGLALSQRLWGGRTLDQVVAGQPELVPDPEFDNSAAWSLTGGVSVTGGRLVFSGGAATATPVDAVNIVVGRCYRVEYTIDQAISGSAISFYLGGYGGQQRSTVGTFVEYIVAPGTGKPLFSTRGAATFIGSVSNFSVKEVSRYAATQTTTSAKPKVQDGEVSFDAVDDNWLTNFVPGAGANLYMAKVRVPASISATQIIAGSRATVDTRSYISLTTNGRTGGGVGSSFNPAGLTDYRGQTVTFALAYDATTVRLFEGNVQAYGAARAGVPTTTVPVRIGALNDNGTAAGFTGVGLKKILCARTSALLDLETFNRLAAEF